MRTDAHHPTGGYPRERGGTPAMTGSMIHCSGLSPRARGNVFRTAKRVSDLGAIPASAGERSPYGVCATRRGGYPRERGGTLTPGPPWDRNWGLSPRARGNEKSTSAGRWSSKGLSPRARGNGAHIQKQSLVPGAIPASAGERPARAFKSAKLRGYPRERGGTMTSITPVSVAPGLSPRARGNVGDRRGAGRIVGAIPASAGERLPITDAWLHDRGYPRERGGTRRTFPRGRLSAGLSPRARGNALCADPCGA